MLNGLLAHPLTRGLDVDDPRTTELRLRIIREKEFLRRIYQEWYERIAKSLPEREGAVLELGSGAGFMNEHIAGLITSEVFPTPGVEMVIDATRMPFRERELRGVVMTNVLHHIPNVRLFFQEAARTVRAGGVISMIEPWVTRWSRLVYGRLHHEPCDPEAAAWEFPSAGPLSSANEALAWIVFARDREQFQKEFPQWRIERVEPLMPFTYLVSGGVSMRSLMPGWSYGAWRAAENLISRFGDSSAMFAHIVLVRNETK